MDERDRTIEELKRANKRLTGALDIVLDTLDSGDINSLFTRTLEKIATTVEADGTIAYLAQPDGFHLRGISSSLKNARVPQFMAFGQAIESLAAREGHSLRLVVRPHTSDELRSGKSDVREVEVVDTGERKKIPSELLPPFACFITIPVWFSGHIISIIELGWRSVRTIREDDVALLDSVANYLSLQIMSAFTAMRASRRDALEHLASNLRDSMLSVGEGEGNGVVEHLDDFVFRVAEALSATAVRIDASGDTTFSLDLPHAGRASLPMASACLLQEHVQSIAAIPINELPELALWLESNKESTRGALLDMGELIGNRRAYLLLKDRQAEPFDADERAFLTRFAQDVRDAALGEEAREEQVRISQALQMGMRSELQKVAGIKAEGLYSSATASALVGGDFYDLVRLPDRRACVIMGDVSGKGVEAASVSAAVRTALAAYAWEGLSPARMVRSLNDFLLGFSRIETFATLFVGLIDLAEAKLTYCSAGHPPALLVRARTHEAESLGVQSGVVGAFSNMNYRDGRVELEKNDTLVLYTDGSTEARSPDGAFFGEEGFREALLSELALGFDGLVNRLLRDIDSFTGSRSEDDVALLALRFDELG